MEYHIMKNMDATKFSVTAVKEMDVDELQRFLEANGFSNTLTNKLKEEEINCACLLMLKEVDLNSFGFKTGSKIKLRNLIENLITEHLPKQKAISGIHEKQLDAVNVLIASPRKLSSIESPAQLALCEVPWTSDIDFSLSPKPASTKSCSDVVSVVNGKESYNVLQILKDDPDGKKDSYLKREVPMILNEERITIVQVTVNNLTAQETNLYPTSIQKHALAEAIVNAFPCLKCDVPGVSPHCSFYNNKTNSFIETRLKKMRQRSNFSKKRKNLSTDVKRTEPEKKKNRTELLDSGFETEKQQVIWMKERVSNKFNNSTIDKYMENTFDFRRLQIDTRAFKCASEILEAYPRFIDYGFGSLIITEYYRLNKEAASFENFDIHYKENIIVLATCDQMGVGKANIHETSDRCLSALMYCVKLQPTVAKMKVTTSVADVIEQLIVFRKENWDTHELENNRSSYSS